MIEEAADKSGWRSSAYIFYEFQKRVVGDSTCYIQINMTNCVIYNTEAV